MVFFAAHYSFSVMMKIRHMMSKPGHPSFMEMKRVVAMLSKKKKRKEIHNKKKTTELDTLLHSITCMSLSTCDPWNYNYLVNFKLA